MIPFSAIAEPLRVLLLLLLVLAFLAHALCFYLRRMLNEKQTWTSLIMAACNLPIIPLLCPGQDPLYQFQQNLPLIPTAVVLLALTVYSACRLAGVVHTWNTRLTPYSVKEAMEQMPVGLAYFDDEGRMVLSNRQMERLVFRLTGCDLQMIDDLKNGLLHPMDGVTPSQVKNTWLFRDGTAWSFTERHITDAEGTVFTEWIASDITEQEHLSADLHEKNEDMQRLIARMQRISVHTADLVREQEILAAKVRVHHQMGSLLLTTRRYLSGTLSNEEKKRLIQQWREGLGSLQAEVGSRDAVDVMEEVIRVSRNLGVVVEVQGNMPEQKTQRYLLAAALRECVTNTLRHAEGNLVRLRITQTYEGVRGVYTNNGTQPKGPIREGGGLSSLRKTIENAGGFMIVNAEPIFRLILDLPDAIGGDEFD